MKKKKKSGNTLSMSDVRRRLKEKYPKAVEPRQRLEKEKKSKAEESKHEKNKEKKKSGQKYEGGADSINQKGKTIGKGVEKVLGRQAAHAGSSSTAASGQIDGVKAKTRGQIFDERLDRRFRRVNKRIAHGKRKLMKEPSEDFSRTVAHLVQHGNFPDVACRSMGVSAAIFRKWVEAGFDDMMAGQNTLCARFVQLVDTSMAQHEVKTVAKVDRRINNWQALTWLLERKSFQRWSQKNVERQGGSFDELRARKTETTPIASPEFAGEVLAILEEAGALTIPGQEQPGEQTIIDITGAPIENTTSEADKVLVEVEEGVEAAPAFISDTPGRQE